MEPSSLESSSEPSSLEFNALDWGYTHEDTDDYEEGDVDSMASFGSEEEPMDEKYVIRAYGKTLDGKSVYCKIIGFTPYFYVLIPQNWAKRHVEEFVEELNTRVSKKYRSGLIDKELVLRKKFYGFTAGKNFRFMRLVFNNYDSYKKYQYLFSKPMYYPNGIGKRMFDTYEAKVDPLLRFMHIRKINPAGWLKLENYKIMRDIKDTNLDIEVVVPWLSVFSVEKEAIAPFVICSFDIECNSSDGILFPEPTNPDDKIIQIGSTFSIYGSSECYYRHIVTLGSCDSIEGADVESYDNEVSLLLGWRRMLKRMKPDILTGYNIFGFDEYYIYKRYELIQCDDEFLRLSCLTDQKCEFNISKLSSSALGDNTLKYFDIPGLVQIDLMKVMQRDHRLDSYKLDNVISTFVNDKITKKERSVLNRESVTILHTPLTDGLYLGNYFGITINDSKIGNHPFMDGKKFKIMGKTQTSLTIREDIVFKPNVKYSWCLVKDDVSPTELFKLQKGSSADRKRIAEYCLQDCAHCNRLINNLRILTNNICMANVSVVPFQMIFTRGQSIKIYSLISKTCRVDNYLIIDKKFMSDKEKDLIPKIEGAIVFDPIPGVYQKPITVLDFGSLYPSCIKEINASHETLVDNSKYDNLPNYDYIDSPVYYENDKPVVSRFAISKDGKKAILPRILTEILTQRKNVKKQMKSTKDSKKLEILDGHQLALKVTANSVYGQMGAVTSPVYCRPIAASTTAVGRMRLKHARSFVEENYSGSKIIYGDTDSIFIDFNLQNSDGTPRRDEKLLMNCIELGNEAADKINAVLPKAQTLEYEKTFYPFVIVSKKRYVGVKYEDNDRDCKQASMGLVLKRRDNARIVKYVYNGILDNILYNYDADLALKFTKDVLDDICCGKFGMDYFVVSKTLKGTYKDRSRIAHAVLADRMGERDPGNKPQINDRIPYIAVVQPPNRKNILQGERIEHPDYILEKKLKIDYIFYIKNQIMKPCLQILELISNDAEKIFKFTIDSWENKRRGIVPITAFFKKKSENTDKQV